MLFKFASGALLLASIAQAAPMPMTKRGLPTLTANLIQTIAPNSSTCDGAPYPAQCRTAAQAVTPISQSFCTYKITTPGEAAAAISWMAFESADFKYQNNMFPAPGRPGQGTRNMMMWPNVYNYAKSIPALANKVKAMINGASSPSNDTMNSVRALLTGNDAYDFGSAAWFLTTQCSSDVRTQLQTGSLSGWENFITKCVSTTVTDERQAYWTRAIAALK